jgi:hypothetical protein
MFFGNNNISFKHREKMGLEEIAFEYRQKNLQKEEENFDEKNKKSKQKSKKQLFF